MGQVILEYAAALRDAVPIILHHHERYAGHGYPYGLRAKEIPLGARIVAIADAYDAMTHDRPYRRAISHEAAIAELRLHAGTQFDPELVALFCDLYASTAPTPDRTVEAVINGGRGRASWHSRCRRRGRRDDAARASRATGWSFDPTLGCRGAGRRAPVGRREHSDQPDAAAG